MRAPRRYALGESLGEKRWGVRDWRLPDTVHFAPWWKAIPERLAYAVWIRLLWLKTGLCLSRFRVGACAAPLLRGWVWPPSEFLWRWREFRHADGSAYPLFAFRYTPLGGYWWGVMWRGA